MLFPKGQHLFFTPTVAAEGEFSVIQGVTFRRIFIERKSERFFPVGNFQSLFFSIDFEAPKDIFVVEIGSGVGKVAIYFGNHFPSDLSEELRAAQRQPSVSDPVVDAAVIGRAGDITKTSF